MHVINKPLSKYLKWTRFKHNKEKWKAQFINNCLILTYLIAVAMVGNGLKNPQKKYFHLVKMQKSHFVSTAAQDAAVLVQCWLSTMRGTFLIKRYQMYNSKILWKHLLKPKTINRCLCEAPSSYMHLASVSNMFPIRNCMLKTISYINKFKLYCKYF